MPSNVYNASWFSSNLVRKYPLDSMASCVDDGGDYLPDDIITDINISYPRSLGEYCHIAAVNITNNLISIVIACGETTIAACCVARPVDIGRYYTLDSLYDGVAGVIALNLDCTDCVGSWTFSDPASSRILPTCCTVYDPPEVLSLSRTDDASPLTGDILLTAGNDIELTIQPITVDGTTKKAIFIGLPLDSKIFQKYITECEIVTEADTCGRKYTAALGGAVPNCDGDIQIISSDDSVKIDQLTDGVLSLSTGLTIKDMCPAHIDPFKDYMESDSSSSGGGGGGDKSDSCSKSYCGYCSPISPNICEPSGQKKEVSPLIAKSRTLDLSMFYINLYTSDIQIVSGGAVYGDGPGFTNAEPGELIVKTEVKDAKKLDIQLIINKLKSNYAFISIGDVSVSVDNSYVYINNYTTEVDISDKSGYHIVFTPDFITIKDANYSVVYQKECKIDLSNEIFITINGIKCETIAYE